MNFKSEDQLFHYSIRHKHWENGREDSELKYKHVGMRRKDKDVRLKECVFT